MKPSEEATRSSQATLPRVVVKLGGSLLRRADWPLLLAHWLSTRAPSRHAIICGGGEQVDQLRLRDQARSLGDEACHWLAIAEMSRNTVAAAAQFPQSAVCSCLHQLDQAFHSHSSYPAGSGAPFPKIVFFDCQPFLREETQWRGLSPLPHSWDVSSDSIAARIAVRWQSARLILLKSASPDVSPSCQLCLHRLAQQGYVDAYFPQAAVGLVGEMVNLTGPAPATFAWDCRELTT